MFFLINHKIIVNCKCDSIVMQAWSEYNGGGAPHRELISFTVSKITSNFGDGMCLRMKTGLH